MYVAYGTGNNGVVQILDRQKLLTDFTHPLNPTDEEMLAPQVGYIVMSPDQGAHTTMPIFDVPVPASRVTKSCKSETFCWSHRKQGARTTAARTTRRRRTTGRRLTSPGCSTSRTRRPRGRCRRCACRRLRETTARGVGDTAFTRPRNRSIPPTTGSWPLSLGSTQACGCGTSATPLDVHEVGLHSRTERVQRSDVFKLQYGGGRRNGD